MSVALPWKLEVKNKHLKLQYDTGKTIVAQSEISENFIWLYNIWLIFSVSELELEHVI